MGEYTVTELFEDITPLFTAPPQMGEEVFPFRLKPMKIFKEPVEINSCIPELGFVTNKTIWSGHFRQAMREIPLEDYQRIIAAGR